MSSAVPASIADKLAEGNLVKAGGKWDAALAAFQQARVSAHSEGDARSESLALAGMAEAEFNRNHDEATRKYSLESLALAKRINDKACEYAALRQLSAVQYRHSEYKEEHATLERLFALAQELGDRKGIAIGLNNLGNLWRAQGELQPAIGYLERAEKAFADLGDDRSRGVVLNNLGTIHNSLGDYDLGAKIIRKGLELEKAAKDDVYVGQAYNSLGVNEMGRGNYQQALQFFQQALESARRTENRWGMAEVFNNMGIVFQEQQNHEQAIAHFRKGLAINRGVGSNDLASEAHYNLGDEMMAVHRIPEAVREYRESLRLAQGSNITSTEGEAHRGLGCAFFQQKRLAEAEAELLAAAAIQRAGPDPPSLAQTYVEISRLKLHQGLAQEALAQAQEAEKSLSSIGKSEGLWQAQLAAGRALRKLGRDLEAGREFEASIATIEASRTRVVGPSTSLPVYFANKLEPYEERVALALAAGKTQDALQFAERSKSRALGDLLRSGHVDLSQSLTAVERAAEQGLERQLVAVDIQISNQPSNAKLEVERARIRRELEALQNQLYAAHPETAFVRGRSRPMSTAEMTAVASDLGATILDYVVMPGNSYVFVIRRGTSPRVVALGIGQASLARKASEFHRQLASHDLAYEGLAQQLYRLLLAPVEHELDGPVIIVPHGPLWDIAFHALQPAAHHFLIEKAVISYAPSLAVLRETVRLDRERRNSPAPRQLLAVGNPAGRDSLPEAERQVHQIEALYGSSHSRVLTGAEATQNSFKQDAGRYRVLHLASHAVLDGLNPMYSRALLARSTSDSGILEARELMQLKLKAELLVLSACETARGTAVGGEGINGMLWAAFVAGAPTTVASLWRVESASTSDLMIALHRNWLQSRQCAKAAALRNAALSLIGSGKFSHPFYWAGFILMGSPL